MAVTPIRSSPLVAATSNRPVNCPPATASRSQAGLPGHGPSTMQQAAKHPSVFTTPSRLSGDGSVGTNYLETTVDYDSMSRQNKTVSADGTITRTVINPRDQVVSTWIGTDDTGATDANPTGTGSNNMVQLTATEYDNDLEGSNSLVTKTTQLVNATAADNRIVEFEYDWRNRQIKTIALGPVTDLVSAETLDNLGRSVKSESLSRSGGVETLITRTESLFDERGRTYRTIRHGVNQDTGALTSETITVDMEYDATGNLTKQTPAGGSDYATFTYDSLGRQTTSTNALGFGSTTVYNDVSQVVSQTNELGHTSTSSYDEVGRMVESSDPLGNTSESEYDLAGRMSAQIDPLGNRTEFAYDDAGRQTTVTDPAGKVATTVYNSVGQVDHVTDPLGGKVLSSMISTVVRHTSPIRCWR